MTDKAPTTEPRTEAGKRLYGHLDGLPLFHGMDRSWGRQIAAIEAEAASRSTPSLDEAVLDVERLRLALDAHMEDFTAQPESFDESGLVADNIARHYTRLSKSAAEETEQ